jgi:nitroreductase
MVWKRRHCRTRDADEEAPMELFDAIYTRRAVRAYTPEPVDADVLKRLLEAATQAPSATNSQPWAFGVITDAAALRDYATRAKAHMLAFVENAPGLARYRELLGDPTFDIFYGAPALVLIYAKPIGPQPAGDCCLAAMTLWLAAHGLGLGACWIGFAQGFFDTPEMKAELGVAAEYHVAAPLIIGHPAAAMPPVEKAAPDVLFWRS